MFSAAAQYVRDRFPADQVAIEAAGFHGATERTVIRHFVSGPTPDYLVLWCRPWEARFGLEMARTVRSISPTTRIVVWGDACNFIPLYFQRPEFDLIVVNGDPERVIADAVDRLGQVLAPEHGVLCRDGQLWHTTDAGKVLDPEFWPFPAPDAIDPAVYRLSRVQRSKSTDDLSFMVSRGCPINCAGWCPTPPKAYVQIGLPGQTRADLLHTLRVLTDLGIKPRFTGSTPFWKLAAMSMHELDQIDLRHWDRKSYYDPRCGLSHREFYQLITSPSSFTVEDLQAWAA